MNREAIFSALFTQLQTASGFLTFSRRYKAWDAYAPSQKPVLTLYQDDDEYVQTSEATPHKATLDAYIFIYTYTGDPNAIPASIMNPLLDAIDTALAGGNNPFNTVVTLGGLVSHAWREGKGIVVNGDLDGNGWAMLPLKILVPV